MNLYEAKTIVNEFRLLPTRLKPYTKMDSFDIPPLEMYSSEDIEEQVLEQVNKSSLAKPVLSKINEGLKKRRIIVGYSNPSKFNFIKTKVKHAVGIKKEWALGFYDYTDDTVYMILDDTVRLTGNSKHDISSIIVHELCHMAMVYNKKTKIFENSLNSILIPFYKNFFDKLQVNLSDKDLKDLIVKLCKNEYQNKYVNSIFNNAKTIYNDYFNEEISEQILGPYIKNYKKYSYNNEFNNIENIIRDSYKNIGIITPTIPGQEMVIPSEVIAIYSDQKLLPSIAKSINKIPMR